MPSSAADTALRDILHHIELANDFVKGLNEAAFLDDVRTIYAVTRVWTTVTRDLPPLRAVILQEIERLG
jgi:uncharacterized protein with HEPN domain